MPKNRAMLCVVVAFIILSSAGFAGAQTSSREKESAWSIDITIDLGKNSTTIQDLRPDWRKSFYPDNGGKLGPMSKDPWSFGVGLGFTRVVAGTEDSWQLRIPVSYQIVSMGCTNGGGVSLAKTVYNDTPMYWWDTVTVNDTVVKHYSPRVGLEFAKNGLAIAISAQHYRLVARDYLGVDCKGCTNTSEVSSSRTLESGISPRLDLYFHAIGFYIETSGSKTRSMGLTIRARIKR